jgi:hypothetical protein
MDWDDALPLLALSERKTRMLYYLIKSADFIYI